MRGRPLFWAIVIGLTVAFALALAIFDADWRRGLKGFQVALGGLGALAAALAQHDGATAAVREGRRKELQDRDELRRRLIIQCRLDAYNLYHICLARAKVWAEAPPSNNDDILRALSVVARSEAIENAWEHVALFSDEVAQALSHTVRHTMAIAGVRAGCIAFSDAPDHQKGVGRQEGGGLVETLVSTAKAAEQLAQAMANDAR